MKKRIVSLIISIRLFKELEMKQKIKIIAIGMIILLLVGIYMFPYIKPIKIVNKYTGYEYMVYGNYAEITKYRGDEVNLKIPSRLWGRKVKKLGRTSFSLMPQIESVVLSKYLEEIGVAAFALCENLTRLECGEQLEKIGDGAFAHCYNLCDVSLNQGLKDIEENAFAKNKSLESILIPRTVKKIGDAAFEDTGLINVEFQDSNLFIGNSAFKETPWLLAQKDFVVYGDHVLLAYHGEATEIVIPDGIKYICTHFADILNLKKIYITETVTYIADYAFSECKDVTVYIPESVTEIGKYTVMLDEDKKITIVTTAGSYAETYAKENGIQCEIVDEIVYPEE